MITADGHQTFDSSLEEEINPILKEFSKKRIINFHWRTNNEITFFETPSQEPSSSGFTDQECTPKLLDLKMTEFLPKSRRLICDSHGLFLGIQTKREELLENGEIEPFLEFLFRTSIKYRAVQADHIAKLKNEMDAGVNEHVQLYQESLFIWHLMEIFFLSPLEIVTKQLIHWQSEQSFFNEQIFEDAKEQGRAHSQWWNLLKRFIVNGNFDNAKVLLKICLSHDLSDNYFEEDNPYDQIYRLLERHSEVMEYTLNEFEQWREDCRIAFQQLPPEYQRDETISLIFRILSGDQTALHENCKNWIELMIAELVFIDPFVRKTDIQYVARKCKEHYDEPLSTIDNIYFQVISQEPVQVIQSCGNYFGKDHWLVAHVADILHHRLYFDEDLHIHDPILTIDEKLTLRDYYLLEYASSLLSTESLWQIACSYLNYCPNFGKAYMEEFIQRQSVNSGHKAFKILKTCEDYQLQQPWKATNRVTSHKLFST